jgi:hypothetical protein
VLTVTVPGISKVTKQREPFSLNFLGILIVLLTVALAVVWVPVFLFMLAFDYIGEKWRKWHE